MIWILGPVCLIVSLIALLASYEATVGVGYYTDEKDLRPPLNTCPYAGPPERAATRGVIFLVEGLRSDSGLTYPNPSTLGQVKLQFSQTRSTVVALATGRHDSPLLQLSGRPATSDNVFRYAVKTEYAGPDDLPRYFTEGKWFGKKSEATSSELQNIHLTNITYLDRYTEHQIKQAVNSSFNNPRARYIFVVHLVQIQLAAKFAGIRSAMYKNAVRETSETIQELTRFFHAFYGDNSTFFMAVSTHGTDERGKYGGGSTEETLVPLATWGKGSCRGPKGAIQVEDLCPLVAGALGHPIPRDSRGNLPNHYLSVCVREEAGEAVTVQTAELCLKLSKKAGPITRRFLQPGITPCQLNHFKHQSYDSETGKQRIIFPSTFYKQAKQCVANYDNSYRTNLLLTVAAVYSAWIIFMSAYITPRNSNTRTFFSSRIAQIITVVFVMTKTALVITLVVYEHWPWYVVLVLLTPIFLWGLTLTMLDKVLGAADQVDPIEFVAYVLGTLVVVEVGYWCEYYVYTAPLFLIPYCAWTTHMNHKYVPKHVVITWISSTVIILAVPLIMAAITNPTMSSSALLNIGATAWIIGGCLFAYRMDLKPKEQILAAVVAAKATAAIWIVDLLALRFWETWLAVISWILVFTPVVIFFASDALSTRLMQFCLVLSPPFLLLCYRQEPFILLVLSVHLYSWLRLEASSPQYKFQSFLRSLALHFYLIYSLTAMAIPASMTSYETVFVPLFHSRDSTWLTVGLNWYKVTLITALVVSFWTAASMYIGSGVQTSFNYLLLLAAITAFRNFISFAITKTPLPWIIVSHLRFFVLIPPLIIVPLVISVTKYKETMKSRPV